VERNRRRYIREVLAQFKSFDPKPDSARVRYVAPGKDFRDCDHASQAEDMPGCEAAHVYASVEGRPPPRLVRKLPKSRKVERVPQREPVLFPPDETVDPDVRAAIEQRIRRAQRDQPVVLPADIREALV
jgi:hypothetical protein